MAGHRRGGRCPPAACRDPDQVLVDLDEPRLIIGEPVPYLGADGGMAELARCFEAMPAEYQFIAAIVTYYSHDDWLLQTLSAD
jgi:hypothetical protein